MQQSYRVEPIRTVISSRTEAIDDRWDAEESRIQLSTAVLGSKASLGLADFSHVEVLYLFHEVSEEKIETDARRPRGNPAWPEVGILAQRGKNRPNRLGATTCRLKTVEGDLLIVEGLDAIDGTPVLDVKPVMKGFLPRGEVREPAWAQEIMAEYW